MTFKRTARPPQDWGVVPDEALLHGDMRRLFCLWESKITDELPYRRTMKVHELAAYLPHMVFVNPDGAPPDFRISFMGSAVVNRSLEDRTGQKLREVPAMAPGTRFWRRFEWMWQNRTPLFSEVEYVGEDAAVRHVHDLVLPVMADDRRIACFLTYVHYVRFTGDGTPDED
jgi:hypothetical protein